MATIHHSAGVWTAAPCEVAITCRNGNELKLIGVAHWGKRRGIDCEEISREEAEANARLMGAAPDLLTALDYLLQQTIDQDLKHGIGLSEGEEDARAKALAAIAKARG